MKKSLSLIFLCFSFNVAFTSSVMASEIIQIAAIFAKTGVAAKNNISNFQGVIIAVEEINARGGLLDRPVEIIEIDNKSTPLGSKQAALEAVRLDVTAVIGASWSSHSLAMAPVLQQAQIPMISNFSTNPAVTKVGDYIFRVCFTDPFQGKIMAGFARRDLKAQTAVILKNINSNYSLGLAEFFTSAFTQGGGKILWEGEYKEKSVDFSDLLQEVQALKPDVVFVPGYERDSGFMIKQARGMGIQTVFLGGDGWGNQMFEYGGATVDNNYYSSHWHPDIPSAANQDLMARYRSKFGPATNNIPLAYDAVMVLADAVRRAHSLDRKKIRDALAATQNFQGATGTISFDENGDPEDKDAVILKLEKGASVFVKTIRP